MLVTPESERVKHVRARTTCKFCLVSSSQVELLVMKALSLGLVKGEKLLLLYVYNVHVHVVAVSENCYSTYSTCC